MHNLLHSFHYQSTVRAAHGLAELLKRKHPEQRNQADELQALVTRTHQKLDELQRALDAVESAVVADGRQPCFDALCGEVAESLNTLKAAQQALNDLCHAPQKSGNGKADNLRHKQTRSPLFGATVLRRKSEAALPQTSARKVFNRAF